MMTVYQRILSDSDSRLLQVASPVRALSPPLSRTSKKSPRLATGILDQLRRALFAPPVEIEQASRQMVG
jgi:hypothetical protein